MFPDDTLESAVLTKIAEKVEPISLRDILGDMGVAELLDAKDTVETILLERVNQENANIRSSIDAIARATGVPYERVLETLTPEKTRRVRVKRDDEDRKPERVKYRHPDNPSLTWSGRGREPKWLEEARNDGYEEESLLAN